MLQDATSPTRTATGGGNGKVSSLRHSNLPSSSPHTKHAHSLSSAFERHVVHSEKQLEKELQSAINDIRRGDAVVNRALALAMLKEEKQQSGMRRRTLAQERHCQIAHEKRLATEAKLAIKEERLASFDSQSPTRSSGAESRNKSTPSPLRHPTGSGVLGAFPQAHSFDSPVVENKANLGSSAHLNKVTLTTLPLIHAHKHGPALLSSSIHVHNASDSPSTTTSRYSHDNHQEQEDMSGSNRRATAQTSNVRASSPAESSESDSKTADRWEERDVDHNEHITTSSALVRFDDVTHDTRYDSDHKREVDENIDPTSYRINDAAVLGAIQQRLPKGRRLHCIVERVEGRRVEELTRQHMARQAKEKAKPSHGPSLSELIAGRVVPVPYGAGAGGAGTLGAGGRDTHGGRVGGHLPEIGGMRLLRRRRRDLRSEHANAGRPVSDNESPQRPSSRSDAEVLDRKSALKALLSSRGTMHIGDAIGQQMQIESDESAVFVPAERGDGRRRSSLQLAGAAAARLDAQRGHLEDMTRRNKGPKTITMGQKSQLHIASEDPQRQIENFDQGVGGSSGDNRHDGTVEHSSKPRVNREVALRFFDDDERFSEDDDEAKNQFSDSDSSASNSSATASLSEKSYNSQQRMSKDELRSRGDKAVVHRADDPSVELHGKQMRRDTKDTQQRSDRSKAKVAIPTGILPSRTLTMYGQGSSGVPPRLLAPLRNTRDRAHKESEVVKGSKTPSAAFALPAVRKAPSLTSPLIPHSHAASSTSKLNAAKRRGPSVEHGSNGKSPAVPVKYLPPLGVPTAGGRLTLISPIAEEEEPELMARSRGNSTSGTANDTALVQYGSTHPSPANNKVPTATNSPSSSPKRNTNPAAMARQWLTKTAARTLRIRAQIEEARPKDKDQGFHLEEAKKGAMLWLQSHTGTVERAEKRSVFANQIAARASTPEKVPNGDDNGGVPVAFSHDERAAEQQDDHVECEFDDTNERDTQKESDASRAAEEMATRVVYLRTNAAARFIQLWWRSCVPDYHHYWRDERVVWQEHLANVVRTEACETIVRFFQNVVLLKRARKSDISDDSQMTSFEDFVTEEDREQLVARGRERKQRIAKGEAIDKGLGDVGWVSLMMRTGVASEEELKELGIASHEDVPSAVADLVSHTISAALNQRKQTLKSESAQSEVFGE